MRRPRWERNARLANNISDPGALRAHLLCDGDHTVALSTLAGDDQPTSAAKPETRSIVSPRASGASPPSKSAFVARASRYSGARASHRRPVRSRAVFCGEPVG